MVSITILDIVILAILAAVLVICARRGFALTACALVGDLIALILAIICAGAGTSALISSMQRAAGAALEEQLGAALPEGAAGLSGEAVGAVLRVLESSVLRPMVFALAFLLVLVVWQYACLHFPLLDRFPDSKKFDQLYGAGLGLLKGIVLLSAALYVLVSLGIIAPVQIRSSLLLGRLWALWKGVS